MARQAGWTGIVPGSLRVDDRGAARRAGNCLLAACGVALGSCLVAGCADRSAAPSATPSAPAAAPSAAGGSSVAGAASSRPASSSSAPSKSEVSVRLVSVEEFSEVIAAQKGDVVLVDFWATYCGPCRETFPKTLALGKKYADRGLKVVSMSMDAPDPDYQRQVIEFLRQQNATIINLANRSEDTDEVFQALAIDGGALPHYKVFNRQGRLRAKFGGDIDHPFTEKDIEAAVVAALSEK
jgi:thiol-disulfide isomerase/thioredoxin